MSEKNIEDLIEKNIKRNEKYLIEFEEWLISKNLSKKTIKKHLDNARLYIDNYLNYYDVEQMEVGIYLVDGFLGGWFIEKCLWSSKNSIKETASSIKKFYECMSEKEYIKKEEYKELQNGIKENMNYYLNEMDAYEDGTYFDLF